MEVAFSILFDSTGYNLARKYQLAIRKQFGAKETLLLEPHATIKYAFETNNLKGIEEYFGQVATTIKAFEIEFVSISSFDEDNIVFLSVAKSEILTNLHIRVLEDLKNKFQASQTEFEGPTLHFHTTLAYKDITTETFNMIMEYFKNENIHQKISIKQLGLWVRVAPEDKWFLYKIGTLQ